MSELTDKILGYDDARSEVIEIPEWGGVKIKVRSLRYDEAQNIFERVTANGKPASQLGINLETIVACCSDPDTNEQLFSKDNMKQLKTKHPGAIKRIMDKIGELTNFKEQFDDAKKNLETDTLTDFVLN